MSKLDLLLVIMVSLGLIASVFLILMLLAKLNLLKQVKQVRRAKPKRKGKRRSWKRQLTKLNERNQRLNKQLVIVGVSLLLLAGLSGYTAFYQKTNMSKTDFNNLVTGDYLLGQMTVQLQKVKENQQSSEQSKNNIQSLGIRLASFSAKTSSTENSKEGQLLLNRYYKKVGQFGVDIAGQDYLAAEEQAALLQETLADIEQVMATSQKVLTFYKIDRASLPKAN